VKTGFKSTHLFGLRYGKNTPPLKGRMHMDELVALAIVAAIAGGNYKSAGVVAFFLLLANLIETRTALGAKASIESLIRLAPTLIQEKEKSKTGQGKHRRRDHTVFPNSVSTSTTEKTSAPARRRASCSRRPMESPSVLLR